MSENRKFRGKNIEELIEIIEKKEREITVLQNLLEKYVKHIDIIQKKLQKEEGIKKLDDTSFYNQKWTWLTKLKHIIKLYGRPLRSADMLEYLVKHDERAKYWRIKPRCLSVHINKAVRYEWLITYKIKGIKGFYYCLPEWFGNGELKPEIKEKIVTV